MIKNGGGFLYVTRISVSLWIKDTTSYRRLGRHSSFAERTSSEKTQKDRPGQCGASMYYVENKKVGILRNSYGRKCKKTIGGGGCVVEGLKVLNRAVSKMWDWKGTVGGFLDDVSELEKCGRAPTWSGSYCRSVNFLMRVCFIKRAVSW